MTSRALILCCPLMVSPYSLQPYINRVTVFFSLVTIGRLISRSRRNVNLAGLRANRRRPRRLSGTVGTAYAYVRKGKSGQPTSGSGEPPPHYSVSDSNVSATFPLAYTSHQIIQISKCMRNTNDAPIKSMDTFVSPAL